LYGLFKVPLNITFFFFNMMIHNSPAYSRKKKLGHTRHPIALPARVRRGEEAVAARGRGDDVVQGTTHCLGQLAAEEGELRGGRKRAGRRAMEREKRLAAKVNGEVLTLKLLCWAEIG
jgi:hypothetical protein